MLYLLFKGAFPTNVKYTFWKKFNVQCGLVDNMLEI